MIAAPSFTGDMVLLTLLLVCIIASESLLEDPSDFFRGSKRSPRLYIESPENGEVLEDGSLEIRVKVSGYHMSSPLHDSELCVGLSSSQSYSEECFGQSEDHLTFTAQGLSASTQYSLRVVLFERGNAIAMSVRSFRVGGLSGILREDEAAVVTISTALEVAVRHQTSGAHKEAEQIYRQILEESPYQPDALHLLGLIFFLEGDPSSAVPYIERALLSNRTYEGFHNSLGECYRALDRLSEAKKQFELALDLNPSYMSARFNLALTYQQADHLEEAIQQYRFLRLGAKSTAVQGANDGAYVKEADTGSVGDGDAGAERGGAETTTLEHAAPSSQSPHDRDVHQNSKLLVDSAVRECDLLGLVDHGTRAREALRCWEDAYAAHPSSGMVANELGTAYGHAGRKEDALRMFQLAVGIAQVHAWTIADAVAKGGVDERPERQRGEELTFSLSALLNAAHILEVLGYADESCTTFKSAARKADAAGLPHLHVLIREATVMPRIMDSVENIASRRAQLHTSLDALILRLRSPEPDRPSEVDNSPPPQHGFSLGYFLAAHGDDNRAIKSQLYMVYSHFCPGLLSARFIDRNEIPRSPRSALEDIGDWSPQLSELSISPELLPPILPEYETNENGFLAYRDDRLQQASLERAMIESSLTSFDDSSGGQSEREAGAMATDATALSASVMDRDGNTNVIALGGGSDAGADDSIINWGKTLAQVDVSAGSRSSSRQPSTVRVGLLSRYFHTHAVGFLTQGLVVALAESGYHVSLFVVDDGHERRVPTSHPQVGEAEKARCRGYGRFDPSMCTIKDPILAFMVSRATDATFLPADISQCARIVEANELDLLIFPEIGMDPIAYFLSYARTARVQAAMLGHADTTGVPTVDYFISSVDESPSASERYTENLVRMRGLGTFFIDSYSTYSEMIHTSPRTAVLERAKLLQQLHLPRPAHLYLVNQPLYRLHPSFDVVLAKVLSQDRLAHVVLVDGANYTSWQTILRERVSGLLSDEQQARLVFYSPRTEADCLRAIAAAHILLDPFPAAGYLPTLQALAIGTPVITLPGVRMNSRFALALYSQLGVLDLVATDENHYVELALHVTHQNSVRTAMTTKLLDNRHKLFQKESAVEDWKQFIEEKVMPHKAAA